MICSTAIALRQIKMVIPATSSVGEDTTFGLNCVVGENVSIGARVKIGNMCVIEDGTVIADDVVIDHFCIIGEKCAIGRSTRIRSHVELRKLTKVGADCYIDSGVKSSGLNRIGDRVTLRYDAIIARGCDIQDDAYICPQVMTNNLDHNGNEVGGATIGPKCFIGTNSTIGAGIKIAERTVIGSKAMVVKTIEEAGVYVGVPAKKIKDLT